MNTQSSIDQAVSLHRSGNLAEAQRLYREVLAADPQAFAARHLLGVTYAQQGRGEEALVEIAAEMSAEVIVIGASGKGFFRRLLSGSVSDYVVHHAHCPVLVVRHDHLT